MWYPCPNWGPIRECVFVQKERECYTFGVGAFSLVCRLPAASIPGRDFCVLMTCLRTSRAPHGRGGEQREVWATVGLWVPAPSFLVACPQNSAVKATFCDTQGIQQQKGLFPQPVLPWRFRFHRDRQLQSHRLVAGRGPWDLQNASFGATMTFRHPWWKS